MNQLSEALRDAAETVDGNSTWTDSEGGVHESDGGFSCHAVEAHGGMPTRNWYSALMGPHTWDKDPRGLEFAAAVGEAFPDRDQRRNFRVLMLLLAAEVAESEGI